VKHLVAVCLLAATPLLAADNGRMSDSERAFLVDKLEQTKTNISRASPGSRLRNGASKPRRIAGR
jgi:hypothetical protein